MKDSKELKEFLVNCIYEVKSDKLPTKKAREIARLTFALCQVIEATKEKNE